MRFRILKLSVCLGVVPILALTSCVNNTKQAPASGTAIGSTPPIATNAQAAALLPASVVSADKLVGGTNIPYAPSEYRDPSGKIVGFEVDLLDGIAATLGLTVSWQESGFDNIIPSVESGKFDVGMSSFTDTKAREKQVSFINYYNAGYQWASATGHEVDPQHACGQTVAVQDGTVEQTVDLPQRSRVCVAAGKPAISVLKFDSQDAATESVILGRADAFDADSPTAQYAVKRSGGKLQLAGGIAEASLDGIAVAKNQVELQQAIKAALQVMIDNGSYQQILRKWGVQAGAIKKADINGALK